MFVSPPVIDFQVAVYTQTHKHMNENTKHKNENLIHIVQSQTLEDKKMFHLKNPQWSVETISNISNENKTTIAIQQ